MKNGKDSMFRYLTLAGLLALLVSGCTRVTVFADLSHQVAGSMVYRAQGEIITSPYARAGIEASRDLGKWEMALGLEHRSFPFTTKDRGEERVYTSLRYHMFTRE